MNGILSHEPVLVKHIKYLFQPHLPKVFLDLTFGAGGHSKLLLNAHPQNIVVGTDRDPLCLKYAQKVQEEYKERFFFFNCKFSEVSELLSNIKFDGILVDLGCSSMQLEDASRGFSYTYDGPLSMQMDDHNKITAHDVINSLSEKQLSDIFSKYGEEKYAEKIADAIVRAREAIGVIETTKELSLIIESAFYSFNYKDNKVAKFSVKRDKLGRFSNVAVQTFQAIRTFVNDEYNEINCLLPQLKTLLKAPNNNLHSLMFRPIKHLPHSLTYNNATKSSITQQKSVLPPLLIVIAFHSLEDRIVKMHLNTPSKTTYKNQDLPLDSKREIDNFRWEPFNKHVIEPDMEEIDINPRARSAKLRAAYVSKP